VDGIGDTDLHEAAYAIACERNPDATEPSDDDYADAFMLAVDRALTEAP
jgi:hypothetical protein